MLLAKALAPTMEAAVAEAGSPPALVGILIATLVLMPEGLAALRAARASRLQTSMSTWFGARQHRPDDSGRSDRLTRHGLDLDVEPRSQINSAIDSVAAGGNTIARHRTHDRFAGHGAPGAFCGIPVHHSGSLGA